jgi:hypothetical protein
MLRFFPLRLVLPALLAALVPLTVIAQSQDSQSVAEAARKARAKKKNAEKPAKVITDDTLDVKKGDVKSAAAQEPRIPGSPETSAQPGAENSANAPAQGPRNASDDEKARAALKERVALKEKIKAAQSDLDLLQREYQLDQDAYYSKVDYAKDTAGKDKLDAEKQQISDKQQELEQLKARLAALPEQPQESSATAPPQP